MDLVNFRNKKEQGFKYLTRSIKWEVRLFNQGQLTEIKRQLDIMPSFAQITLAHIKGQKFEMCIVT